MPAGDASRSLLAPMPMPAASQPDIRNQFALLSQMIEDISGELALEPLLARMVERACRLIGADDGVIGLYEPAHDAIRTAASYRIPDQELHKLLPRGHGLTGRVLELDAPLRCRYGDLPHPTRVQAQDMDMIGMPIRVHGRMIGVFGIGAKAPARLNDAAEELLDLFARHAAIAIVNAQRYAGEQRRAVRFALIARVAGIIAAAPELEALLQHAADAIHELLDYQNVDIPLVDPQHPDTLLIRIRGGGHKRQIRHIDRLAVGQGVIGAAAATRRTQLVNVVSADPRYITPPGMRLPQAELAVPIVHGGDLLGVLNVEGDHHFDELDQASLEIVAECLGIAIANARLFQRSKQLAVLEERQRLARDLHDNVTQILSSMSLITQSLPEAWHRDQREGDRRAARLAELARLAFAELRAMLDELSPTQAPTAPPPFPHLPDRLQQLLTAMVPPNVRLELDTGSCPPQAEAHEEGIVRVCQEAVSNAVRHAAPSLISIQIVVEASQLRLRVSDDGHGIGTGAARGMGLDNMRQRLVELGGRLRVVRNRPRGTLILARLPRNDRRIQ